MDLTSSATTNKTTTVQNYDNSNNINNNISLDDKTNINDKNSKVVRLQQKKLCLERKLLDKYQELQQILKDEQNIISSSKPIEAPQHSKNVITESNIINNNNTKDQTNGRRKIGTSFKLAENLLLNTGRIPLSGTPVITTSANSSNSYYSNSNNIEEEKQQKQIEFNNLLLDKQINQEISKASYKLSQDPQQHKSIRRMHKKSYEMTQNKLAKIEQSIKELLLKYDINPVGGVTTGSNEGGSQGDTNSLKIQKSPGNQTLLSPNSFLSSNNNNPIHMERCNSMKSSNSMSMIEYNSGNGNGLNMTPINKIRSRHDSFSNYPNSNSNYEFKSVQYSMSQQEQIQQQQHHQSFQKPALNLQFIQQHQYHHQQHNKQLHTQHQQQYNQKPQYQHVMMEYLYNEPMADMQTSTANPVIVDDLYTLQQPLTSPNKYQPNITNKPQISPQTSPRFQHPYYPHSPHLHQLNYQQQLQILLHQQPQGIQKYPKQMPSPSPSSSSSTTSSSAAGAMASVNAAVPLMTTTATKSPRNSPQHRGLGGYWTTTENNEKVWCPVDNIYSSLDRNKIHNNHNHYAPQYQQNKLKSQSNATSINQLMRTMIHQQHHPKVDEPPLCGKSISLGNFDFITTNSGQTGIKSTDDLSDTMSVTSVSSENKKREKIWRETSLDTPNLKPIKPYHYTNRVENTGYMMNGVGLISDNYDKECPPPRLQPIDCSNEIDKVEGQERSNIPSNVSEHIDNSVNDLSRPYVSTKTHHSPNIGQSNVDLQDIIQMESPKNMTIVQQGKILPYKEITKPFEMSDFYKYSTKFRQKQKSQTIDSPNSIPAASSTTSHKAQIQKIIYQPPNPSICHPIVNNFN